MIHKKPFFSWIKERYLGWQITLLCIIVVTVFFRVVPLEMQKRIVNDAIAFRKLDTLFAYCGLYLGAVIIAGCLKYAINVLQGYLGQRILYDMRTHLYMHVLQLSLPFFRKNPPGMVISTLSSELTSVGDFLGGAFAIPVVNTLTLVTFAGYMFYLNPLLAGISMAIYPFEIVIIPILQKRFNILNSRRIDVTRKMNSAVGEAISGIYEIHANAAYGVEHRRFTGLAHRLFRIRHRMNLYKYGIKFVNNFFQSLGPFMLFLVGGYLSIQGRFSLGALIAFLSAYEKLYDPWKELMDYYQNYQTSRVAYRRVQEAFAVEPEFALAPPDRVPVSLQGRIEAEDVSFDVDGSIRLLDRINLELKPGERMALVGLSGSGKSTLAMVLGQLLLYSEGQVKIDGRELKELTKLDISTNIGFVPQYPFIFDGDIRENILYACRSLVEQDHRDGGNNDTSLPENDAVLDIVNRVALTDDVLRFGLNTVIQRDRCAAFQEKMVRIRHLFHERWSEELVEEIEFFDERRFLQFTSLASNIIFGFPSQEEDIYDFLPKSRHFQEFLRSEGLEELFVDVARQLLNEAIPILSEVKGERIFFDQTPIRADELDTMAELWERIRNTPPSRWSRDDHQALITLALKIVPGRHSMAAVPVGLRSKILESRARFRHYCQERSPGRFIFYDKNDYLHGRTLLDNILFGRVKEKSSHVMDRILSLVIELLKDEALYSEVLDLGLEFQVGSKGDRLSGGQKQKIGLARTLLKHPKILILDEATASLDMASQARVEDYLAHQTGEDVTIISVVHRLELVKDFDKIAVMKAGKIVESGSYGELMRRKGLFHELVEGR